MNTETKVVAQKSLLVSLSILLVAFYDKQVAPRLKHLKTVTLPYLGSGVKVRWKHLKTVTAPWIANGISAFFHWAWYTAKPAIGWGIGVALNWLIFVAPPAVWGFICLLASGVKMGYKWAAPKVYYCQIGTRTGVARLLRWIAKKVDPNALPQAIILTPTTPAKAKTKAKKPLTPDHDEKAR